MKLCLESEAAPGRLAAGAAALLAPEPVWGWSGAVLRHAPDDCGPVPLRMGTYLAAPSGEKLLQVAAVYAAPATQDGPAPRRPVLRALRDMEPDELAGLDLSPVRDGFSVAWITLSDKGAAGLREDKAGPAIETACRAAMGVSLARGCVLPDEPARLRATLCRLAYVDLFDLVVTTGGTGLAPRDTTPETTLTCIERRLPGFEQAMMAASLAKTPKAVISRAVAGAMGGSIVVNLPGSPKAVAENLEAVLPAMEHALEKLQGDPSDCAA